MELSLRKCEVAIEHGRDFVEALPDNAITARTVVGRLVEAADALVAKLSRSDKYQKQMGRVIKKLKGKLP